MGAGKVRGSESIPSPEIFWAPEPCSQGFPFRGSGVAGLAGES